MRSSLYACMAQGRVDTCTLPSAECRTGIGCYWVQTKFSSDGQPQLSAWSQQAARVYNCDHGHVIAALAHQLLCVLTNSDHLAIMVTTSSLIETSDSERLQSSFHLNFACYGSVGSADVLCPNQQRSYCDHGHNKQPDWNCWQRTIAIICWSKCCMLL